jgi:hypothetical protein
MRFRSPNCFIDLLDYEIVLANNPDNVNLSVLDFIRFNYQKMSEILII